MHFSAQQKLAKIAIIFILVWHGHHASDFSSVLEGGDEDNPGAVLRVTKKGISYFAKISGKILNKVIRNLQIPKFAYTASGVIQGTVTLTDVNAERFKKPKRYIGYPQSPDKLVFKMKDLELLRLQGHVVFDLNIAKARGHLTGDIEHLDMEVTVSVDEENGKPKLTADDCKASIGRLTLDTRDVKGSGKGIINLMKSGMESMTKKMLSEQICTQAKNAIDCALNEQFKKLSGKYPLKKSDASASEEESADRIKELLNLDLEKYSLDYDFLDKPKITNSYFQSKHKGEISYEGHGGTPFYPKRFSDMRSKSSRHIYFQVSEYTINSLLYHAYQNGLCITANYRNLPRQRKYFQTKCKPRWKNCFGNVAPWTTRSSYPDHWIEMQHTPSEAPYSLIEDRKVKMCFEGDLSDSAIRSDGTRDKVIEAYAAGIMSLEPRTRAGSLHGRVYKVEQLSIGIAKGTVNAGKAKFKQFTKKFFNSI